MCVYVYPRTPPNPNQLKKKDENIDCSGPPYIIIVVVLNFLGGPGEEGGRHNETYPNPPPPPPPCTCLVWFGLVCSSFGARQNAVPLPR